ncbi:MAG: hypothetical protein ACRDOK_15785 [Streptosporangiaceae bacterium]
MVCAGRCTGRASCVDLLALGLADPELADPELADPELAGADGVALGRGVLVVLAA